MMAGIEPILQWLRIKKVQPWIKSGGVLVDFGCDEEQTLIRAQQKYQKRVIGVDIVAPAMKSGNLEVLPADLEKKLPLASEIADTVTMLAVLEHMPHPERSVGEAYRILKKGGQFLVTVPSVRTRDLFPWLLKFGLVRQDMIGQHENYFSPTDLKQLARQAGFRQAHAEFWELGCNVFLRAVK